MRTDIPTLTLVSLLALAGCGDLEMSDSDAEINGARLADASTTLAMATPPADEPSSTPRPSARRAPTPVHVETTATAQALEETWVGFELFAGAVSRSIDRTTEFVRPLSLVGAALGRGAEAGIVFCGTVVPADATEVECAYSDEERPVDLRPLARLSGLTSLRLGVLEDVDWSPLAALKSLEVLELEPWQFGGGEAWGSELPPMAIVARLSRLKRLRISLGPDEAHVPALDLSPLTGLRHLTDVTIDVETWGSAEGLEAAGLTQLRGLRRLRRLKTLALRGVTVLGRRPIRARGLRVLSLRSVLGLDPVRVAASQSGLRELTLARLDDRGLRRLVARLPRLSRLTLIDAKITRLDPLTRLRRLKTLAVRDAVLVHLSPLSRLTGLRALDLSGCDAGETGRTLSLAPLARLGNLRSLTLSRSVVRGFEAIAGLPLEALDVSFTSFDAARHLAGVSEGLTALGLAGSKVSDLTPLLRFQRLRSLDLSASRASEPDSDVALGGLLLLPALQSLDIVGERFDACSGDPDLDDAVDPACGQVILPLIDRGVSVSAEPERGC